MFFFHILRCCRAPALQLQQNGAESPQRLAEAGTAPQTREPLAKHRMPFLVVGPRLQPFGHPLHRFDCFGRQRHEHIILPVAWGVKIRCAVPLVCSAGASRRVRWSTCVAYMASRRESCNKCRSPTAPGPSSLWPDVFCDLLEGGEIWVSSFVLRQEWQDVAVIGPPDLGETIVMVQECQNHIVTGML